MEQRLLTDMLLTLRSIHNMVPAKQNIRMQSKHRTIKLVSIETTEPMQLLFPHIFNLASQPAANRDFVVHAILFVLENHSPITWRS